MQWWFCLKHMSVEHGPGCPDESRLGPYPDEVTAQGALARMATRERDQERRDDE